MPTDVPVVDRVVQVLVDTYLRQSLMLRSDQVESQIQKRGLSALEGSQVAVGLRARGVTVQHSDVVGFKPRYKPAAPIRKRARSSAAPDVVKLYLDDIGEHPLLTEGEEVILARRVQLGAQAAEAVLNGATAQELDGVIERGREAADRMLVSNLRLVVSIARRSAKPTAGLEFLDLVQEGTIGLMRAVQKFDGTKGFRFSTYATWWIRQAISRAVADKGRLIRLPVHVHEFVNRINHARERLRAELQRTPTVQEIASTVDLNPAKVQALLDIAEMNSPVSIDARLGGDGDDEGNELIDFLGTAMFDDPADVVQRLALADAVAAALRTLGEREERLMKLRFGLDEGRRRTLEEVGQEFGVTRERIRQIESKCLERLGNGDPGRILKEFVVFQNEPEDGLVNTATVTRKRRTSTRSKKRAREREG